MKKEYNKVFLVRNERAFHIYSFQDGERFEPDFVLFLQRNKTDGFEQMQIFIEPKGTQLLEKDNWKEKFLLQMEDKAVPVKMFADDNEYRIWGFHFFNQENRMKDFAEDFSKIVDRDKIGTGEQNIKKIASYEIPETPVAMVAEPPAQYGANKAVGTSKNLNSNSKSDE